MSALENGVFFSIDRYLHSLTQVVGEDKIEVFKQYMIGGDTDHSDYLNRYISWSQLVKQDWAKYKISVSPTAEKIKEYEEKLQRCDGYLGLLTKILDEDVNKKKQINALLEKKLYNASSNYVLEDDVDKAFVLIKTMPYSSFISSKLSDIFDICIEQKGIKDWKKAYEVLAYEQQNSAVDMRLKLDQIIEKCLALKVKAAEEFVSKILQFYPKCEIFNSS